MTSLADSLTYAHEKDVLHRDIKPSNILIDDRDLPYITDFGLARIAQVGESTISHDMMLGTPFYISPEQAKGNKDLTPTTDIYSFGIILYELLVGTVPFTAETPYAIVHKHIYNQPTPPSHINKDLTSAIDDVILKALAKNPADRYQTAIELMLDFTTAMEASGVIQLPPDRSVVQKTPKPQPQAPSLSSDTLMALTKKLRYEQIDRKIVIQKVRKWVQKSLKPNSTE
jgi:serine/threonine-protein kinase